MRHDSGLPGPQAQPAPEPHHGVPSSAAARRASARVLRSLRHRNFRLFFAGHAVSVIGTWMQRVAQDWLVLDLTGSGVALGVAAALQFGPTLLFALWGGAVVDRVDRRRAVIVTQAASAALAVALAAVTLSGAVRLWMVYALCLGLGMVTVVDSPARQALITEMVPPADYVNAQALASTVHNTGRLIGPAIAGVLIAAAGTGVAFAVNAVSFAAVLVALLRMRPSTCDITRGRQGADSSALDGLRYVLARPQLRVSLLLVAVVALFGQNFRVVLPLLARTTLHAGPSGYGALTSALGAGAVVGALASAARENATPASLRAWTLVFGAVNLLAAAAPTLLWAAAGMVAVGVANITFNTLGRTILQLSAAAHMQGRVIALHSLVFLGSTPLGGPLLGWWCGRYGARAGLALAGATAVVAVVLTLPAAPTGAKPKPAASRESAAS